MQVIWKRPILTTLSLLPPLPTPTTITLPRSLLTLPSPILVLLPLLPLSPLLRILLDLLSIPIFALILLLSPPLNLVIANRHHLTEQAAGLLFLATQHHGAFLHVRGTLLGFGDCGLGFEGEVCGEFARHTQRVEDAGLAFHGAVGTVLFRGGGQAGFVADRARETHAGP